MRQRDERDERRMDDMVGQVRSTYHVPSDIPREQMWQAIVAGIAEIRAARAEAPAVDLDRARRSRSWTRHPGWWAVAAAALVVLGIGIGRSTAARGGATPAGAAAPADVAATDASRNDAYDVAAREHLGRTESLLTLVRADARNGSLDPATAEWAQGLLSQTRLLIDARRGDDRMLNSLLEDLELVLVQIVGVSGAGSQEAGRARTELQLTLKSLEQGEVLGRIQAALPAMEGA